MSINAFPSGYSNNDKIIICNDMNINILKKSNDVSNYINILASFKFYFIIDSYTRVTDTSRTCIDHIFIKNINISKALLKSIYFCY